MRGQARGVEITHPRASELNKADVGSVGEYASRRRRRRIVAQLVTLGPATLLIGIALIVPLVLMFAYSVWKYVPGQITDYSLTLDNYGRLFMSSFYLSVLLGTVEIGLGVTVVCLLMAYPVALYLARTTSPIKGLLSYLLLAPLMVGIVVRAYGWMIILGRNGLVNAALIWVGVSHQPLQLLYTRTAVIVGLVEILLPFATVPLISSIEDIDRHIEEAARVLGATKLQTFRRVTLPLSWPGMMSASLLVFSLSITAYALPALLGGGKVQVVSGLAYDEMLVAFNYPFGSAIGMLLVVLATAMVFFYLRLSRMERGQVRA